MLSRVCAVTAGSLCHHNKAQNSPPLRQHEAPDFAMAYFSSEYVLVGIYKNNKIIAVLSTPKERWPQRINNASEN